jgi:hypothetical protein
MLPMLFVIKSRFLALTGQPDKKEQSVGLNSHKIYLPKYCFILPLGIPS